MTTVTTMEKDESFPGGRYEIWGSFQAIVDVADPSVVSRCVNNEDGWRDHYYDYQTYDEVLQHLVYNCVVNGVERVNRLDGWADLDDDAATMRVAWVEVD